MSDVKTKEFKALLSSHDWYYIFSGDSRVYSRGKTSQEELKKLCKDNKKFHTLYENKRKEIFKL